MAARRDVIVTFLPMVAFLGTAIPLWGEKADLAFFSAASNVLALGGIALVIQARYFQPSRHSGVAGMLVTVNLAFILVSVGLGLGFAFGALGNGEAHDPDLAVVAGAMATQIATFAVNVLFGPPAEE